MAKLKTACETFDSNWLSELDGRTSIAGVMRQRFQAFSDDLGGVSRLSYQQKSLVERCLWLEYWLVQQEQLLASGGDFDVGKWVQAVNSLQGILSKLGLVRVPKDIGDLAEFLAQQ